ncbi:MAG: radical SAM protein [Ignavibacteriaceae bacterium]|nr:radical SAM protein [Ignavibacteriaceae bacterium]
MKILLVYPEMPDTFYSFKHLTRIVGRKASFPPLGLLTVASMLPNDWELKLIDTNVNELEDKDIRWGDMVFISAMNTQANGAYKIIERCKSLNATIVAGGPLFTHEYDRFPNVDYFVLNEAEITLPLFLKDFKNNELKRIYKTNEFADIHETPIPRWELVNLNDYAYSIVQYSRGCPYFCEFCDITALFGRKPRTKTAEQIIEELETILRNGKPGIILFADDNLIGNKGLLKAELLPKLIEWRDKNKYAPGFDTQVTINLSDDDELMQLMIEAGFRKLFIGIESLEEEALLEMNKKQNTKRNLLDTINKLHSKGFIIVGGFILGLDTDTPEVFQNQIDFINESGMVLVSINLLKAPIGTELYNKMKKQGRLLSNLDFDETKSNMIHKMDKNILDEGYRRVIENIYSAESVFYRAKVFLSNKRPINVKNGIKRKTSFAEIMQGARVAYLLGIKDNNRLYFWQIFYWLFRNRKLRYLDLAAFFIALLYQYKMMKNQFVR